MAISTKPIGSKIILKITYETIEITIPSGVSWWWKIFIIGFAIVWIGVAFLFLLFSPIVALFPLGIAIFIIYLALLSIFGKTKLKINQATIALSCEIFELKLFSRTAPRRDISKIELTDHAYIQGDRVETPPHINIWAGNTKFDLAGGSFGSLRNELSSSELQWLGWELSDWLDLPIV
jgi:hypothetical protein